MLSMPFLFKNCSETSYPKMNPAPRGLLSNPLTSSGSLHSKSHIAPIKTREISHTFTQVHDVVWRCVISRSLACYLHEESLALYLVSWYHLASRSRVIALHVSRRWSFRVVRWEVSNRRGLWSTSRHLRCRTSSDIHRRNRRPTWFDDSHGCLAEAWCDLYTSPSRLWGVKRIRLSSILDPRSLRGRDSSYQEHGHLSWRAQWDRGTAHECHHKPSLGHARAARCSRVKESPALSRRGTLCHFHPLISLHTATASTHPHCQSQQHSVLRSFFRLSTQANKLTKRCNSCYTTTQLLVLYLKIFIQPPAGQSLIPTSHSFATNTYLIVCLTGLPASMIVSKIGR